MIKQGEGGIVKKRKRGSKENGIILIARKSGL